MSSKSRQNFFRQGSIIAFLLISSLILPTTAFAIEIPTARLVSPKLNENNSLDITSKDLAIGSKSNFRPGSKSFIYRGPEIGKELKIEYLITKDGINPWPNKEVFLLMGGGYSDSNASWSWNGKRYGVAWNNFYSTWMEKIPVVTDSKGIASFSLQNIDPSFQWYHTDDLSAYTDHVRIFLSTRFQIEIPGYTNFTDPYFLQDVIRVVISKSTASAEGTNSPSSATPTPTPTATPNRSLTYNFSTSITKMPPKTIKWGKSFQVSIKTSGSGGANCEMVYQNPGWPSRQGITNFRLTAGRTTSVTVRPWARFFLSYPLKYVCIPDGWPRVNSDGSISIYDKRIGDTIGYVTIVP
jgi:hypothetical protein